MPKKKVSSRGAGSARRADAAQPQGTSDAAQAFEEPTSRQRAHPAGMPAATRSTETNRSQTSAASFSRQSQPARDELQKISLRDKPAQRQAIQRLNAAYNELQSREASRSANASQASDEAEAREELKLYSEIINQAESLPLTVRSREVLSNEGLSAIYNDRAKLRFAQVSREHQQQDFFADLSECLDVSRSRALEVNNRHLSLICESVSDFKRALELGPGSANGPLVRENIQSINASHLGKELIGLFMNLARLVNEAEKGPMQADPSADLAMQANRLSASLFSLTRMYRVNKMFFAEQGPRHQVERLMQAMDTMLEDMTLAAIDLQWGEPAQQHEPQPLSDALLNDFIRSAAGCRDAMTAVRADAGQTKLRKKDVAGASRSNCKEFVFLPGPTGMTLAAQVQADGSAVAQVEERGKDIRFVKKGNDYVPQSEIDADHDFQKQMELDAASSSTRSKRLLKLADQCLQESDVQRLGASLKEQASTNPNTLIEGCKVDARDGQRKLNRLNRLIDEHTKLAQLTVLTEAQRASHEATLQSLKARAATFQTMLERLEAPGLRLSMIKNYRWPQADQWEELHDQGQLKGRSAMRSLSENRQDNKTTLFECAIFAKPDQEASEPRPVWLHVHTKKPMTPDMAKAMEPKDIRAMHLKADHQKDMGAKAIEAQREAGVYEAVVHRATVKPELLKKLLALPVSV